MTGIYRLSIECMDGPNLKERFIRKIEVSSDTTLADLHFMILELVGFDDSDHLADFYLSYSWHGWKTWLTVAEDGDQSKEDGLWETPLSDLFPLPRNRKLYHLFDHGMSWIFEIRKKGREKKPAPGAEYPCLVAEEGPQPVQHEPPEDYSLEFMQRQETPC